MNTRFEYLYRDASNYKKSNEVILKGLFGHLQIKPFLKEQEFFIPSEVGLPDLQDEVLTVDDHIWHEVVAIAPTEELPTIDIDADMFIARFEAVNKIDWNEDDVAHKKGLI